MVVLILAILLFIVYNLFIVFRYKTLPDSLSETSYIASPTWFSSILGTEALLILVPWLNRTEVPILPYIGTIALIVCGSAPLFRESFHKTIHYVSAMVALVAVVLWVAFNTGWAWWYTLSLPVAASLIKPKQFVYWTELWAFLLLSLVLLLGR